MGAGAEPASCSDLSSHSCLLLSLCWLGAGCLQPQLWGGLPDPRVIINLHHFEVKGSVVADWQAVYIPPFTSYFLICWEQDVQRSPQR